MMESRDVFKEHGRWKLMISPKERARLVMFQNRHKVPYLRERAAALLQVSDGKSPHWVARHGLLKAREPNVVYEWLRRYARMGVAGLFQKPRRHSERLSASEGFQVYTTILTETPEDYGFKSGRWTLGLLRDALDFVGKAYQSVSGVWYFLQRLRLRIKRGRQDSGISWDPEFQRKIRRLRAILGYCRRHQQRAVIVLVDEFSFYRQPLVSRAWWKMGRREQPPVKRSQKSNTRGRIVGAVNCVKGNVSYKLASRITLSTFCAFLKELRAQYPAPVKLYVILDNWPTVHKHDSVVTLMEEFGIIPVWTPTYTPEANPIERLWWQLSEDVLAHHRYSDDWDALKARIIGWLDSFRQPSEESLRLVGLADGKAIPINGV